MNTIIIALLANCPFFYSIPPAEAVPDKEVANKGLFKARPVNYKVGKSPDILQEAHF